MVQHVGLNVVL